jgi:hypothetical protein
MIMLERTIGKGRSERKNSQEACKYKARHSFTSAISIGLPNYSGHVCRPSEQSPSVESHGDQIIEPNGGSLSSRASVIIPLVIVHGTQVVPVDYSPDSLA